MSFIQRVLFGGFTVTDLLGDFEEGSHGVFSKERRSAVGYLDGGYPERPDVCPQVIVVLWLLLTRYHLLVCGIRQWYQNECDVLYWQEK